MADFDDSNDEDVRSVCWKEWVLENHTHPWKRIAFSRIDGMSDHIRLCGEGFQGLEDPMPSVRLDLPTYGEWSMDLDSDRENGACRAVSVPWAREIWAELLKSGWHRAETPHS